MELINKPFQTATETLLRPFLQRNEKNRPPVARSLFDTAGRFPVPAFLILFLLQRMHDLQTVAVISPAYNPVSHRNDCKEKLEEVEIQKEDGYRKQDFTEAAPGLNKPRSAEIKDSVQDGLQQGKERPDGKT